MRSVQFCGVVDSSSCVCQLNSLNKEEKKRKKVLLLLMLLLLMIMLMKMLNADARRLSNDPSFGAFLCGLMHRKRADKRNNAK